MKFVLHYLKRTQDYSILFSGKGDTHIHVYYHNFRLKGYSDTVWGANLDDQRSISSYAYLIGNSVISWSSEKQSHLLL